MIRRTLLAAALCAALPLAAHAQAKSTRIVVSFPPGGPVDFVARVLAEQLGKELGHMVIVDNKAGANGAIGAGEVMRSKADGSTLWITSVGAAAINASLYEKLPYDTLRDFTPVSVVVNNVELLVVNPADPARDAAEFVANARKSRNPVTMASSGIGSIPHLAMEQLKDSTKVDLLHVPYKGAAPAITDVMGGQVSGFFGDVPGLITFVRSGKLKPIGIASTRRHPALPEVKTLAEQGIANVDTNNWYALFAPAKTPATTVTALNDAVRRALSEPGVKAKLMDVGAEPAPSTPAELAALVKRDMDKWGKLIQDKKIKAE
ncbi:tripartite tricarboxylate transporter substrate-binding protein [Azohydromonas aeria]|uniref:tripartite tricarboxylate transporter substrate-binding protein n=1 Tax=Azohydromonas aeria TaxID=2590212 RepID=UPI0012FC97B6|nr:tripartite tricarboxylate transporter substrate-binding protein [Azohydromonas aeria]